MTGLLDGLRAVDALLSGPALGPYVAGLCVMLFLQAVRRFGR